MPLHLGKKIVFNGIKFDSIAECSRYKELLLLQRIGEIKCLKVHFRIKLSVNGVFVHSIVPDFVYLKDGEVVVEDVKGDWKSRGRNKTAHWQAFRRAAKLFRAIYGFDIEVIER